jgi:hypothetical protein
MKKIMSTSSKPASESAPAEELGPALPDGYRAAILADATLPEPVRRALLSGLPLERITLDAEGRWWHEGDPIDNPRIAELFHRSIERTPGGTYVLHIAPFTYPIEVKDTPYFVRRCEVQGQTARIYLSDGSDEQLEPKSLRYAADRGFYCAVKGGKFGARFNRPAYYALAEHVEEAGGSYVLSLGNTRTAIAAE